MSEARKALAQKGANFAPICAIGASAGGVTALQNLLRGSPLRRRGFGADFIEHRVPYELQGPAGWSFSPAACDAR